MIKYKKNRHKCWTWKIRQEKSIFWTRLMLVKEVELTLFKCLISIGTCTVAIVMKHVRMKLHFSSISNSMLILSVHYAESISEKKKQEIYMCPWSSAKETTIKKKNSSMKLKGWTTSKNLAGRRQIPKRKEKMKR